MSVYGQENPLVVNSGKSTKSRPIVHVRVVINIGELGDFHTSLAGSSVFLIVDGHWLMTILLYEMQPIRMRRCFNSVWEAVLMRIKCVLIEWDVALIAHGWSLVEWDLA